MQTQWVSSDGRIMGSNWIAFTTAKDARTKIINAAAF